MHSTGKYTQHFEIIYKGKESEKECVCVCTCTCVCVCIKLNPCDVHLKLTQHYKSAILQFKRKERNIIKQQLHSHLVLLTGLLFVASMFKKGTFGKASLTINRKTCQSI